MLKTSRFQQPFHRSPTRRLPGGIWLTLAVLGVCLCWHEQVCADPGRIELGAMAAPSQDTHAGKRRFTQNTYKSGWSAGAWLRYGLSDAWSLQAELLHATRGTNVESNGALISEYNFRYIQIPLLARYGRVISGWSGGDGRPLLTVYFVGGAVPSILLRAEHVSHNRFIPRSAVRSLDVSVMAGLGVAWRVTPRWAASVEVRLDRGFRDAFASGVASNNQAVLLALSIGYTVNDDDGDGVSNARDRCPTEAEDWNGYQDSDGCPDADNDNDGVLVGDDQCPEEPEDFDGFQDEDGCPDPDNDGDGFLDHADACPDEAFPRMGGCPPRFERARIEGDQIVLEPRLELDVNSAALGQAHHEALDQVAELLADYYPTMRLRLEGHADGEGTKAANERLSEQRARAVADYLIGKGIDRERLVEKGYGEDRPIRREEAEAGKRRNRRVELIIIVIDESP